MKFSAGERRFANAISRQTQWLTRNPLPSSHTRRKSVLNRDHCSRRNAQQLRITDEYDNVIIFTTLERFKQQNATVGEDFRQNYRYEDAENNAICILVMIIWLFKI